MYTSQNGMTALYLACWEGHDEIVEILLRSEADANHLTTVRFQYMYITLLISHSSFLITITASASVYIIASHEHARLY